jgi:PadR family transcriptional regulator, regulatory protein PadR
VTAGAAAAEAGAESDEQTGNRHDSERAHWSKKGALYPALFRLVRQGLLKASWGRSDNNRRAKFYELTSKGRKRLREETEGWNRLVAAIASALAARPQEI